MNTTKKALFVITKSNWGGAQRYVYDLATNLAQRGFTPVVAAGGEGLLVARLQQAGVRTLSIPSLQRDIQPGKEMGALRQLTHLFRREQPDIIHLNSSKIGALGGIAAYWHRRMHARNPVRIIFTAHGWGFYEDRAHIARRAIALISHVASRFHDATVVLNAHDLRAAERFIPQHKLAHIPHGIAPLSFLAPHHARAALAVAAHALIPRDALLIGTIAELTRNKGLTFFLDALARLSSLQLPRPIRAIIIGEGEDHKQLEQQIKKRGLARIAFLAGFIPDAHQLLTGFDLFSLPSVKEGSPYAVMEAMAAGLPIVATSVGGIPDLISNEQNGLLVPPKNPDKLAAAMARLLTDPAARARLGANAKATIETRHSLRAMIEKTAHLYDHSPTHQ